MTRRHALLPAVLALVLWGCYVQPVVHEHSPPSPENVPVAIPAGHVHDDFCGHYAYRGTWFYQPEHVHGPGCGHVFIDGRWTLPG